MSSMSAKDNCRNPKIASNIMTYIYIRAKIVINLERFVKFAIHVEKYPKYI